jgi:hypothetical protein
VVESSGNGTAPGLALTSVHVPVPYQLQWPAQTHSSGGFSREGARSRHANLTDLAYEFGYTDQAHFIHDFKAFTNKTPREFAAEMLKLQEIFHNHQNVVFLQSPPNALDYSEQN